MRQERYDIEAAQNILNMLQRVSPGDYEILLSRLVAQAPGTMPGTLSAADAETSQPGFWDRLFSAGSNALTTIADYKLQEQQARAQQDAYDEAVAVEMQRQALLAKQRESQAMEYQNKVELSRQSAELERAAERAKSKFNWALIAAGGLGVVLLFSILARQ